MAIATHAGVEPAPPAPLARDHAHVLPVVREFLAAIQTHDVVAWAAAHRFPITR